MFMHAVFSSSDWLGLTELCEAGWCKGFKSVWLDMTVCMVRSGGVSDMRNDRYWLINASLVQIMS
jgi:hypothetical protein